MDYYTEPGDTILLQKLLDRAILLIMDEHSYTRKEVLEWLSDDTGTLWINQQ